MLKNILNADDVARLQGMGRSASVHLREALVNDCQTEWTDVDAQCSSAIDTTYFKRGSGSNKCTMGATAAAGVQAYGLITPDGIDLTGGAYSHIAFWIRSSIVLAAGDFQIALANAANAGGTEYGVDIPAIAVVDTWYRVTLPLSAEMLALDSVSSVHLVLVANLAAVNVYLDDIRLLKLKTYGAAITLAAIHAVGNENGDVGVVDVFNLPLKSRELVVFSLPCDALVIPYAGGLSGWTSADIEGGAMDYLSGQSDGPTPFIATSMAVQRADNLVGGVSATGERIAVRVVE